jgi:hypothetical protein
VGAAKRQMSLRNLRALDIDGVEQKQAMNPGTPILQPTRGDDRRATAPAILRRWVASGSQGMAGRVISI